MVDYTIDPSRLAELDISPFGRKNQDVMGGYVGKNLAALPALPTSIYSLAAMGVRHMPASFPILGPTFAGLRAIGTNPETGLMYGEQGADEISEAINKNALDFGSKLAGSELTPGLVGDNSIINKVGTGIDIAMGAIPITGGPLFNIYQAAKNINTGIKTVDNTVPIIAEAASFLSPLAPTNFPKAVVAANAVLGGGITMATDTQGSPKPDEASVQAGIDKYIEQMSAVHQDVQDKVKAGVDTSVQGVGQALGAAKEADIERGVQNYVKMMGSPFDPSTGKPPVIKAGFDLGDYTNSMLAIGGVVLGGVVASKLHNAKVSKFLEFTGGKEFGQKSDTVSLPNASNLTLWETVKAQGIDAATPLMRESSNPDRIRMLFEDQTIASKVNFTTLLDDGTFATPNSNVRLARPLRETEDDFKRASPSTREAVIRLMNNTSERDNRYRSFLGSKDRPGNLDPYLSVDNPQIEGAYNAWLYAQRSNVSNNPATYSKQIADIEGKHAFNFYDPANGIGKIAKDLDAQIRQDMANPDVAHLYNSYRDVTRKMMDYMLEQGAIPKKEHTDMIKKHPSFFPVRKDGKHLSALELSSNAGRLIRGDPLTELYPYIEEVVRSVANTKLKTAFVEDVMTRAARGDVRATQLLGRTDIRIDQINDHNRDKLTIYRDSATAKARTAEFRDPMVRYALSGDAGTAAIRMQEGIMKWFFAPARLTEAVNTGPMTAFVGSPFAPIGAAYSTVGVLMNRPAGSAAGLADKLVQDLNLLGRNSSGISRGFRGDPTFVGQVGVQMAMGITSILAKNAGAALENVVKSSWMQGHTSAASLDALGKSMSNYYKASTIGQMERAALQGGATPTVTRSAATMKDLENGLTWTAKGSAGWQVTRNFVHDILGAIGNAPQAAYYKQNKGRMPEEYLNTYTRNILGDPTKSGLGKSRLGIGIIGATGMSSWGNVAVQSVAALGEAAKKNPLGTTMALINTVALPTILITNWNATMGGLEAVRYQYLGRTADQTAGSNYVFIPGQPVENGLEWPIDQPVRWAKVMVDTLYGVQMGLKDGSLWNEKNKDMLDAFIDAAKTRYYSGLSSDAMNSALGQVLPPIPSFVNWATAALGYEQIGRTYVDQPTRMIPNKMAGASESTSKHIDNKWFGKSVSAEFEAIFNNIGGQVARAFSDTFTSTFQGAKEGLSSSDMWKDNLWSEDRSRFGMRVDKSTRMVSGLWGAATTISPSQEAISKSLEEQRGGLMKLGAASNQLRSALGAGETMTGARNRGADVLTGPGPVPFKDKEMKELGHRAEYFLNHYNIYYAGRLKSLYNERNSAQSSEKLTPKMKQQMVNGISREITAMNEKALSAVEQWKWQNSKLYNRDIDLRRIDLEKPIDQFKSLLVYN